LVTAFSFYSFFSEWKTIAFALFLSYGIASQLTRTIIVRILFFTVVLGNVLFLWQGVKPYYRAYLSGDVESFVNLQSQSVLVTRSEALGKFFELSQLYLAGTLSQKYLGKEASSDDALYSTLRRVGYLNLFALSLTKVPEELNHEGGQLLASNLNFALVPRFLNPTKGVKDDGAKVEKYSGFMVSENSSFSLGHYVEIFIDFGKYGMMIALYFFGSLGGRIYKIIVQNKSFSENALYGFGILYVTLDQWGSFQNDAIFVYGLTFFGAICHLLLFQPIYRFMIKFTA
jgi:hypothetical protein